MFPAPETMKLLPGRPEDIKITGRISQYGREQVTQFASGKGFVYKYAVYHPYDKGHTHHERWFLDDT